MKTSEVLLYGGLAAGAIWLWKQSQAPPTVVEQSNGLALGIAKRMEAAQGIWNQALAAVMNGDNEYYASEAVRQADRALTAKEAALLATGEGKLDANGRVVLTSNLNNPATPLSPYQECRAKVDPSFSYLIDPCAKYK